MVRVRPMPSHTGPKLKILIVSMTNLISSNGSNRVTVDTTKISRYVLGMRICRISNKAVSGRSSMVAMLTVRV